MKKQKQTLRDGKPTWAISTKESRKATKKSFAGKRKQKRKKGK